MRRFWMGIASLAVLAAPARAVSITFDYTYDTNGFFTTHASAKVDLEAAAEFYNARLTDSLDAITPGGTNNWTANFTNPATGTVTSRENLPIAPDQILIYVGGFDLGGGKLGQGGPGGFTVNTFDLAFFNAVRSRGQAGALATTPTDFGPWGGSIQFDLNASWYFDLDPATTESFTGNDFYSTALHELGHVLGIGTAGSWNALVAGGDFTGPASEATYGGPVPLDGTASHWEDGTMSTIFGPATPQEAAMSPTLTSGTRKLVTTLDAAGLQDIGWAVVPEPSSASLLLGALALGCGWWGRRRSHS